MNKLDLYTLSASDLNNTKIVKILDVSDTVPYGRRFKVIKGSSECTVVFQDLYLLARTLDNRASEPGEMLEIKKFVDRLIEVEEAAKTQYKEREDFWYKFRTFFHRIPHIFYQFYGVGSHLDRLKQLDQNLVDKCESTLKKRYNMLLKGPDNFIFTDLTPSSNTELAFLIERAKGLKKNYQELGHHIPEIYQIDQIIGAAQQKKALSYIFEEENKTLRDWYSYPQYIEKSSKEHFSAWCEWLEKFEAFVQTIPSDRPNKTALQEKVDELKFYTEKDS